MVFITPFAHAEPCKQQEGTLLILGDSLSAAYGLKEEQGWVSILGQRWHAKFPKVRVVNASVSGSTSAAGLKLLPDLLAKHKPQWVVLELGGNDGLQGKPISYIRSNLIKMITLADRARAEVFLVGMRLPPNLGERYTEPFFKMFHDLAEKRAVSGFLPFLLEGIGTQPSLMQEDGIHPTAEAQELIYSVIEPSLEQWMIRSAACSA